MKREETRNGRPRRPRVLLEAEAIQERVAVLAREIERDFADTDRLICVGILKGSIFFMVDLLKHFEIPVAVDFFQTSSYGAGTTPGEVRIRKDLDLSVRDRGVLLIEDIVDTGYTLRTILDLLKFRKARTVKLCTLLDKAEARKVDVPIDYAGFEIDDVFVVGYGLDYDESYRNLPYVGILEED